VRIAAQQDGNWVTITVTDDGPGIEPVESRVVGRMTETSVEHGDGLGLWLTNWIVTRYGGSFQLTSTDPGTVATIRLPAIDEGDTVDHVAHPPTVLFR
jgi:signal transduction histidine kinase